MRQIHVRRAAVALVLLGAVLAIGVTLLATHWPFTRRAIVKALSEKAGGEVTVRDFDETFFPRPGCVARGVVIRHGAGAAAPPLITIERLAITSEYGRLLNFSKHLRSIEAEGMRIRVPAAGGGGGSKEGGSAVTVDRLTVQNAVLEFPPDKDSGKPFVIQIHRVALAPASPKAAMSFDTALRIPEPPGEVRAQGRFGPWKTGEAFQTPVSGKYTFEGADLGKFNGIAGTLASSGRFEGTIAGIEVAGNTEVPNFEIRGASHQVHLVSDFSANVNGRTGDVTLHEVDAHFLHTTVVSEGDVAGDKPGDPKTVSLEMGVNRGRIQDLLRLLSSGPPGLTGVVNLRFKVRLPPGDRRFLEKLTLTGEMGIADARFTKPETQQGLEHISGNAAGGEDNPANVVSDLKGRISVANGVARLSDVTFRMPGASAVVSGTYHLITHRVDLQGKVHLQEKLSEATTGFKSLLLKALDPIFRRKKHLSVVPVRITGTYGHTSIKLNL